MKLKLLKGLDKDQVDELKEHYVRSQIFRKYLLKVLQEEIESLHASMRNEDNYNSPNWAYLQADRLGQEKALKRVVGLIENNLN